MQMTTHTPWPPDKTAIPFTQASRRAPARPASLESDVFVPLAQSLATGAALLVPGLGLTLITGWPWYTPLLISAAGTTATWLYLLDTHRRLLWLVETISNQDLDGDGQTGQPETEPQPDEIQLTVTHQDTTGRISQIQTFDLPQGVTTEMLTEFARGIPIHGLAQGVWTGRGAPFSRAQYERLMLKLHTAGIVAWIDPHNHAQGRHVTRGGQAALKHLAGNK